MENLHPAAEADTNLSPSENASSVDTATDALDAVTEASEVPADETAKASSKAHHPRTILNRLADLYPNAFHADGRKVRPLAVGILKELQAAREGEAGHGLSMQDLRRALRYYTQGAAYHRAVARGEARINLLGEPAGEVTEEQKAHAAAKLVELEPKLPKRPERPARKAAAEGEAGEAQAERPRRPRNPNAPRGEGRGPGRDGGRGKPRRDVAPRAPRNEPPIRKDEPAAPVLSAEEKLNLLLEKFGGK